MAVTNLRVEGVLYESPDLAAIAASGVEDVGGWTIWNLVRDHGPIASLRLLRAKF